jgi:hypothetical protein
MISATDEKSASAKPRVRVDAALVLCSLLWGATFVRHLCNRKKIARTCFRVSVLAIRFTLAAAGTWRCSALRDAHHSGWRIHAQTFRRRAQLFASGCVRRDGLDGCGVWPRYRMGTRALCVFLAIRRGHSGLHGFCHGDGVFSAALGAAIYFAEPRRNSVHAGTGVCGDYLFSSSRRAIEHASHWRCDIRSRRNSCCGVAGCSDCAGIAGTDFRKAHLFRALVAFVKLNSKEKPGAGRPSVMLLREIPDGHGMPCPYTR